MRYTLEKELVMNMGIMIGIAVLIVAVAIAVLIYYVIGAIVEAKKMIATIDTTMDSLDEQLKGITTETTILLQHTNRLADDINDKSTKLNGIFDGIKGIGETIQEFNESLNTISMNITQSASKDQEKASQAVKWGIAAMNMFKKNK